ncbi:MAG: pantoate--beta-alanine ligase [Bacteroidia bacterium]
MVILKTVQELDQFLGPIRKEGDSIGFVPTMGALHEGHISLISKSLTEHGITVCSIFVNPTQFNDPKDLINYPRTPAEDHQALKNAGCDVLFEPEVNEVYSPDFKAPEFDFGVLEQVMEGAVRPGHFKGMATVVYRLLDLVKPTHAYFGEKDFQQLAIVRKMVLQTGLPVQIVGCETIRELGGLAMSSRNVRLSAEERTTAPILFETIRQSRSFLLKWGIHQARKEMCKAIESTGLFAVEYLEFADATTLQPINELSSLDQCRAFIAVKASATRLIDNMKI